MDGSYWPADLMGCAVPRPKTGPSRPGSSGRAGFALLARCLHPPRSSFAALGFDVAVAVAGPGLESITLSSRRQGSVSKQRSTPRALTCSVDRVRRPASGLCGILPDGGPRSRRACDERRRRVHR
jgi:hypothetical protein